MVYHRDLEPDEVQQLLKDCAEQLKKDEIEEAALQEKIASHKANIAALDHDIDDEDFYGVIVAFNTARVKMQEWDRYAKELETWLDQKEHERNTRNAQTTDKGQY